MFSTYRAVTIATAVDTIAATGVMAVDRCAVAPVVETAG